MEDTKGNLTNADLEEMRNKLTELEMDMYINGVDHRLELKELNEKIKDH